MLAHRGEGRAREEPAEMGHLDKTSLYSNRVKVSAHEAYQLTESTSFNGSLTLPAVITCSFNLDFVYCALKVVAGTQRLSYCIDIFLPG